MVMSFRNSAELLRNAQENELYPKLVAQLEKDFQLANISVKMGSGISPDNLKTVLHEKMYHLIMERFSKYLNLLYMVDVPEEAFKEIRVTDVVEIAEQVSFLILQREFQKVWSKEKYS